MSTRILQQKLHQMFLEDLGEHVQEIQDKGKKPLLCHLAHPFDRDVKAYIFNCTAPPGGRSLDEFKVQLILEGQKRGTRGKFDISDGRTTLIIGYAAPFLDLENGIWVLFELNKHMDFAYSANIQVYLRQILLALENEVYVCEKHNKEILVLCQRKYLTKALQTRFAIDFKRMIERAEHGVTRT